MQTLVTARKLCFDYRGKPLFDNLDLTIEASRSYGLFGPNGSGKTTLLNLLTGLLFRQQGEIQTLDEDPAQRSAQLLSSIFYLPEQISLPPLSVNNYLEIYAPFYPAFDHQAFRDHAQLLDIDTKKKLHTYSHGQKKKFMLAFGLACNCHLNLLDEPTNGLDIPSKAIFRQLIASATSDNNAFVISTHQVKDIENLVNEVVMLNQGKVVFNQSAARISATLSMQRQATPPAPETLFFLEDGLKSYSVIERNHTDQPGNTDLELLFNAVLSDANKINAEFIATRSSDD